jgi:hypothetical protein
MSTIVLLNGKMVIAPCTVTATAVTTAIKRAAAAEAVTVAMTSKKGTAAVAHASSGVSKGSSASDMISISVSAIDPGSRNLAFCTVEWLGPRDSVCSFQNFWKHLYVRDMELIDIFIDNDMVCKSIKSAKPQKLIEAMSCSIYKRKHKLLPPLRPGHHDLVRIEQQPTKNIKTKVLSGVMSSILYLHAKELGYPTGCVDFQSASAKLNVITTEAAAFEILGVDTDNVKLLGKFKRRRTKAQKANSAAEYRVRKKEATSKTKEALRLMPADKGVTKMRMFLLSPGKKDDTADSFLHCVYAAQERFQKLFHKRHGTKATSVSGKSAAAGVVSATSKVIKSSHIGKKRKVEDDVEDDVHDDEVIDMTQSYHTKSPTHHPKKQQRATKRAKTSQASVSSKDDDDDSESDDSESDDSTDTDDSDDDHDSDEDSE